MSIHVSFRAQGVELGGGGGGSCERLRRETIDGSCRTERLDEWSAEWSKPSPGMLEYAIRRHRVSKQHALMVGYDFVDLEAAARAEVGYVNQSDLVGVEMFDSGFDPDAIEKRYVAPGMSSKSATKTADAPSAFAAAQRSKSAKAKGEAMHRSPAKDGR